jgi:hypothetical protein
MIQKCPAGPIKELDRPVKPDEDMGTGRLLKCLPINNNYQNILLLVDFLVNLMAPKTLTVIF